MAFPPGGADPLEALGNGEILVFGGLISLLTSAGANLRFPLFLIFCTKSSFVVTFLSPFCHVRNITAAEKFSQ